MPALIDWTTEIVGLQDLSVTVPKSHELTTTALFNAFVAAADSENGTLDQKVLTARMAAESISVIEDLGILGWSLTARGSGGILRNYLRCSPTNVRSFLDAVLAAEDGGLSVLLRLPETRNAQLSAEEDVGFRQGLDQLQRKLKEAAAYYFEHVPAYNKLKHGFPVVVRLGQLADSAPSTEWEQNVNIVTGITRDGRIRYVDLHRTEETVTFLKNTVEGACRAFKELALVMLFLAERELPLDPVNP